MQTTLRRENKQTNKQQQQKHLEETDPHSTVYVPNSLECVCLLYFPNKSITGILLLPIFGKLPMHTSFDVEEYLMP